MASRRPDLPEKRYWVRAYLLEAGADRFGAWLVDVTYGRIGTRGRRIRYVVRDESEARKLGHENLRRRATAKHRIGVE